MNHSEEHNFDSEPNFPFDNKGGNPFGLPSDYFASFEEKIKLRLELENELAEFPLLKSISKEPVFSIEYQAELTSYPRLETIKKPVFNELEAEYIHSLNQSLDYKIELADELKSYQTFYHLDKINPFVVTEDYFETVASRVKEKIYSSNMQSVSVFDTITEFIFGKKTAFAFTAIGLVGLSIYFYQSTKPLPISHCETLACLEKQEIVNHSSFSNLDDDQLIEMVNVKTLNKQLQSTVSHSDSIQHEEYILDNVNTDQLLEEL
jgi:flagellar assembly factor FliW